MIKQSHSIDRLSKMMNIPVHELRKMLERMIEKGYLADAYIDEKTNRIICTVAKGP